MCLDESAEAVEPGVLVSSRKEVKLGAELVGDVGGEWFPGERHVLCYPLREVLLRGHLADLIERGFGSFLEVDRRYFGHLDIGLPLRARETEDLLLRLGYV